jgi:hypothetical protein
MMPMGGGSGKKHVSFSDTRKVRIIDEKGNVSDSFESAKLPS